MSLTIPRDDQWAREAFLLVGNDPRQKVMSTENGDVKISDDNPANISMATRQRFRESDIDQMSLTTDFFKFNDTAIGGMEEMNILPQASRFADPHLPRYLHNIHEGFEGISDIRCDGLGHWYSENIDDLGLRIHFRFGLPSYQSLWGFFSNFYSSDQSRYVRLGRGGGVGSFIGKAIGWAFSLRLWPYILTGSALKFFVFNTSTKFTTLKPHMAMYWKYVNDVTNTVATNMELSASAGDAWMEMSQKVNSNNKDFKSASVLALMEADHSKSGIDQFDMANRQEEINVYNSFLPDVFRTTVDDQGRSRTLSGINMHAVATRYKRLYNQWRSEIKANMEKAVPVRNGMDPNPGSTAMAAAVFGFYNPSNISKMTQLSSRGPSSSIQIVEDLVNAYGNTEWGNDRTPKQTDNNSTNLANVGHYEWMNGDNTNVGGEEEQNMTSYMTSAQQATAQGDGQENGGADIKEPGILDAISESVSDLFEYSNNKFGQYLAAEMGEGSQWVSFRINSKESVSESFNTSTRQSELSSMINGISTQWRNKRLSMGSGIIGGQVLNAVTGFIGDIVSGVADSLQISGLAAFGGSAFSDIPEHVDEMSSKFNEMSFTIPLRAPYGNDLSRFTVELIPYLMLLVGAVARSTGGSSYTGPFLCEWYCQGRGQSRLAVITGLTVTRAVSEMPWTFDQRFRGLDVQVQLKDLSSVMHMNLNEVTGWKMIDPSKWGKLLFPQDSSFADYTASLASMTLSQQVYKTDKFKRNWDHLMNKFSQWFDPATRINSFFGGNTGQILTMFGKSPRR